MAARLVSIINMKGGVGKSTTAVTLAETLAVHHRRRVLLIDLDPQTNCSIMAGGPERWNAARKADRTLDAFFDAYATGEKPAPLKSFVDKQVTDLKDNKGKVDVDLIACAPELRYIERDIIEKFVKQQLNLDAIQKRICQWFAPGLKTMMDNYDDILIDCPPGISLFAEAALIASDAILVPSIPDYVSRLGLIAFRRRAMTMIRDKRGAPTTMLVLATKYDEAFSLHRSEAALLKENLGPGMFDLRVPQNVDIARAAEWSEVKRTFEQKYGSAAGLIQTLGEEFLAKTQSPALAA
jgi:chromosome partitioning protein